MADFLAASSRSAEQKATFVITVSLSADAHHALCRLRRSGQSEAEVVEKALTWYDAYSLVNKALRNDDMRKASAVVKQFRNAGYGDDRAVILCRALFRQSDKDLQKAFRLFDQDGSGYIDSSELRDALPLMGEHVQDEELDDLFQLVDKDGTGLIDFDEFCTLVQGMNPPDDRDSGGSFAAFRSKAEENLESIGYAVGHSVGSVATGTRAACSAVSAAWAANLKGLSPFELRRAGAILENLRAADYSEDAAVALCKAIFCGQTSRQLLKAFQFFDVDSDGLIDKDEFRDAMKIMAEDMSDAELEKLFKKVDRDQSGRIDIQEFSILVKALKSEDSSQQGLLSAVSDTWARISRGAG
mmetsp:Transcript_58749/g.104466  ORF Transcript_58749/g.104466 Transcript_58749/m.104466 type:complete len:356 (-) Transcript_58749:308-1375(-)